MYIICRSDPSYVIFIFRYLEIQIKLSLILRLNCSINIFMVCCFIFLSAAGSGWFKVIEINNLNQTFVLLTFTVENVNRTIVLPWIALSHSFHKYVNSGISRPRSLCLSAQHPKIVTCKLLNLRGLALSNLQSQQIGFTP